MRVPAPQHHLAARDVGAGIGDELAGRDRAAHVDRRRSVAVDQLGVLDHHHGVGAARDHAAGRDRGRGARRRLRAPAHGRRRSTSPLSAKPARRDVARARGVGGAQREAIDIGAIERRHVDRRGHIMRQHAAERARRARRSRPGSGDRSMCRAKRARASSAETTSRNCSCRAARRIAAMRSALDRFWLETCGHGQGLTTTSVAGRIPFAFGRDQNPAIGLRQRR